MSASTTVQSVVFPRDKFSLSEAKKWVTDNGYKTSFHGKPVDIKPTQYRFRQAPVMFKNYVTKKLSNGVLLVLGVH